VSSKLHRLEFVVAFLAGADWFKNFWHGVLVQQPACRALSNRSLTNWVMIYTNWKARD
jgi:hypothetical protein